MTQSPWNQLHQLLIPRTLPWKLGTVTYICFAVFWMVEAAQILMPFSILLYIVAKARNRNQQIAYRSETDDSNSISWFARIFVTCECHLIHLWIIFRRRIQSTHTSHGYSKKSQLRKYSCDSTGWCRNLFITLVRQDTESKGRGKKNTNSCASDAQMQPRGKEQICNLVIKNKSPHSFPYPLFVQTCWLSA